MATVPERLRRNRDPEDDARARAWAKEIREKAESDELENDGEYVAQRLAEEKRRLKRS